MLERTYIIPLRKEWLKTQRYKRAKKAVNTVKQFLARHMKSEDVRIMPELNEEIWKDGIKSPPGKIKIITKKDKDGTAWGQLFGKELILEEEKETKKKKAEEKKEEKTEKKEAKAAEKEEKAAEEKPTEEKPAEKKEEKVEEKPAEAEEKAAEKTEPAEKPKKKAVKKTVKKEEK